MLKKLSGYLGTYTLVSALALLIPLIITPHMHVYMKCTWPIFWVPITSSLPLNAADNELRTLPHGVDHISKAASCRTSFHKT